MEKRAQFQLVDGAAKTVLRRAFAASDAEVFEAWTNPETLKRWWGPHIVEVAECEMDPREGGSYRITMRMPDGPRYPMFGTVHDVERPVTSRCRPSCPSTPTSGSACSGPGELC